MNKLLLWSLRMLAIALFAGVLVWQVGRRQGNAYVKGTKASRLIEREPESSDAPPASEKSTVFINGSKSFTGSTTINSGTLVIEEKPRPYVGGSITKSGDVIRADDFKDFDWSVYGVEEKSVPDAKLIKVNQLMVTARALQRNGQKAEALAAAKQVLAADPDNMAAQMMVDILIPVRQGLSPITSSKSGPLVLPKDIDIGKRQSAGGAVDIEVVKPQLARFMDMKPEEAEDFLEEFGVDLALESDKQKSFTPNAEQERRIGHDKAMRVNQLMCFARAAKRNGEDFLAGFAAKQALVADPKSVEAVILVQVLDDQWEARDTPKPQLIPKNNQQPKAEDTLDSDKAWGSSKSGGLLAPRDIPAPKPDQPNPFKQ